MAPAEAEPGLPVFGDLLTAFHRKRAALKEAGVTFKLHEQSEVWANVAGGARRGLSYNGLTTAKLDVDLDKVAGWKGAEFYVQAFDIHGHGPTRSSIGNLQNVSNLEATPSLKLYDLWLDQSFFDGGLSIRVGQEGFTDELVTSAYSSLFLNASFGFPGMAAAVLPSGGPTYPMATPFVRAQLKANENVTIIGAVFNGDPAPPGPGDPQIRDRNGTAFRVDDHAFAIGELWYSPNLGASADLPTTYKLGVWYESDRFADQRFDNTGGLLANPASAGQARLHTGDWAFYGIVDQMIWKRANSEKEGVGLFLQIMGGPADRNVSNLFVAGGMNWRAPFADRSDDVFGLAFAYLGISPAARRYSRDLVSFGAAASPFTSHESVLEATYQAPVTDWLTLQPDLQVVFNPGAAGAAGNTGRAPLSNAVVFAMRVTLRL